VEFATEVAALALLRIFRGMAVSVLVQANLPPALALGLLTAVPDPSMCDGGYHPHFA